MAEEEKNFVLQKLFIKDISFETPNSPAIFTHAWEPEVEVSLASNAQILQENLFEVALTVTVTVKISEATAYLAEVTQAGVFTLSGFDQQELSPMVGSYCPNILFPYAREVISDLVTKGGFPPMLLAPVNFDGLYMQHMQKLQEEGQTGNTAASHNKTLN
jgi:preprotein translocase subunit SecB